jgi:hypothetical protein
MNDSPQFKPSGLVRFLAVVIDVAWVLGIISVALTLVAVPFTLVFGLARSEFSHWSSHTIYHPLLNPLWLMGVYSSSLFASGFFLWIVYHLRLLMKAIKAGDPFNPANPTRIRRIGYAIIIWAPLRLISFGLKGVLIYQGSHLSFPAFMPLSCMLALELVFFGLGILVIAQIFERGLQLQREQDLTV